MLVKKSHSRSCAGQSVMELLPAMMMFFAVLFAALSYFKVMRSAVMREEAVRNVAFAKINNSGTLTTPPNHINDLRAGCNDFLCVGSDLNLEGNEPYPVVAGGNDPFMGAQSSCFVVNLKGGVDEVPVTPLGFGQGGAAKSSPPLRLSTYAVVHRRPAGYCGGAY